MSSDFINGSKFSFCTALTAAVAFTGVSNASPPKMTGIATPPGDDDVILLQSGWSALLDIATYTDSTGTLFELDTTSHTVFPPGEGAGTYQIASGFVALNQMRDIVDSGGNANTFSWAYVEDQSNRQRSRPTDKNPLVRTFTLDYDPTLPWHAALKTLDQSQQKVVFKQTFRNGDQLLYSGYISFQDVPTSTRNQNMTVSLTLSINSDIVRVPASFPSGS